MCFSVWQWISVPSQTFHFPNSYWNVIQTVCSSGGNSAADLMLLKHTGTEVMRSTGIILDSHTDQHVFQWGTLISVMFFYEIFDPYVCSCHICPYVSIYARTIGNFMLMNDNNQSGRDATVCSVQISFQLAELSLFTILNASTLYCISLFLAKIYAFNHFQTDNWVLQDFR